MYHLCAPLRAKTAIRSLTPMMSDTAPMPRNARFFHGVPPASRFVVFKLESSESTDSTTKPAFSTQLLMLFLVNPQRCHGGLSKGNHRRPSIRRSVLTKRGISDPTLGVLTTSNPPGFVTR